MIFNVNDQLTKQNRPDNLTQVHGRQKALLGLLGYDGLGQQNVWGKVLAASPIGIGAGLRHRAATNVAGGSTAADVLSATQDDASAMAWGKTALAFNVAKSVINPASGITGSAGKDIVNNVLAEKAKEGGVKGFFSKFLQDDARNFELKKLNDSIVSSNPSAKNAISDMLSGDMISSIGNAVSTTSNYLKSDEQALDDVIRANYTSETLNQL